MTTKEAGELLGVSSGRVRQLITEGRLQPIKRGRDLFYRRADVVRLRESMVADAKQNRPGPKFKAQRQNQA